MVLSAGKGSERSGCLIDEASDWREEALCPEVGNEVDP